MPGRTRKAVEAVKAGSSTAIDGLSVAILVADGAEQAEIIDPRSAIEEAGGSGIIVSPSPKRISCTNGGHPGAQLVVDRPLAQVRSSDYGALLLPSRAEGSSAMVSSEEIAFIAGFFAEEKPIAALLRAVHPLVGLSEIKGYQVSCAAELRSSFTALGAIPVEQPLATDRNLLSASGERNYSGFINAMLELYARYWPASRRSQRNVTALPINY